MKRNFFILFMAFIFAGCGGKKSDNPPPTPPAPTKVVLTLPAQNAACTTGSIISVTESSITFTWNASANTDDYELDIKNLLDNTTSTHSTSGNQLAVTLLRNAPYSWYVVSKSNKTTATAQSDTWKFYNAGAGVITYAPFPAEIISPTLGQQVTAISNTVNLTWDASSVDGAALIYDVYFGTDSSLASPSASNVTDKFLSVSVISGTTYYWKIVTKDPNGNTSDSGISQFSVQ